MKKALALVVMALAMLTITPLFAQNTVYFMDRLPQRLTYNPALIPRVNFFIGLPGISGEQVEVFNSGLNVGELIDLADELGTETFNPDDYIAKIGNLNKTYAETRSNLFMLGFKLKEKGYFAVSASLRSNLNFTLPSEILYLLNGDLDDIRSRKSIQLDNIIMNANTWSELAFTYSRVFGEKLTIGISPKLNGAMAGFKTSTIRIGAAEPRPDYFTGHMGGEAEIGLPRPINPEAITDQGIINHAYKLWEGDWAENPKPKDFFKNFSLSIDLGANYELNEKWSFSAAVNDLGRNSWKDYGYVISLKDTTFEIDSEEDFDIPELDSVYHVKQNHRLTMGIPSKLYLGASYRLSPKWNAGFLFRHVFDHPGNGTSATLSLNGYVGRMLSTSFSYTAAHSYHNLGTGIRLRVFPGMDLYAVTDNMLAAFNYKSMKHVTVSAGINLAFGIRQKQPPLQDGEEEIIIQPD